MQWLLLLIQQALWKQYQITSPILNDNILRNVIINQHYRDGLLNNVTKSNASRRNTLKLNNQNTLIFLPNDQRCRCVQQAGRAAELPAHPAQSVRLSPKIQTKIATIKVAIFVDWWSRRDCSAFALHPRKLQPKGPLRRLSVQAISDCLVEP